MIRLNLLDPSGSRFWAPDGSFVEIIDSAHGVRLIVRRGFPRLGWSYARKVGPWRSI